MTRPTGKARGFQSSAVQRRSGLLLCVVILLALSSSAWPADNAPKIRLNTIGYLPESEGDFRTNEIAINWNGALIYALAAFLEEGPAAR